MKLIVGLFLFNFGETEYRSLKSALYSRENITALIMTLTHQYSVYKLFYKNAFPPKVC